MASAACVTEKPKDHQNQQQQQQQQVLKCPRCHSSNTKFCYYNNYSLAQPRHFCKGCKRYWTRGGILRNVPVGGGCRKNKRIKKPLTSTQTNRASPALAAVVHSPNPNPNSKPNLDDLPSSTPSKNNSNHHLNPLFQSLLPQNPKYPRFVSRVSNGYDHLHPDPSALGLGFSSSNPGVPVVSNDDHNSNSIASRCPSIFSVGSTSNCTSDPTTASFLASRIQQQPRFLGFAPYEDVQLEGTQYRMDWNNNFHGQNDHNDHIKAVESSDLNSFLWNTTVGDGGDWLDPTSNIGSSLPSLILPKQPD